ncbi:MAG: hypothetical protein MSB12_01700 [Lentisphaeraceae bacterium]|nr:hypothetical protein [Lentisphaeraceae bacterium]
MDNNAVTSDPIAQRQLEEALRAAQLKIVRENKAALARLDAQLIEGIQARMRKLRARQ